MIQTAIPTIGLLTLAPQCFYPCELLCVLFKDVRNLHSREPETKSPLLIDISQVADTSIYLICLSHT